MTNKLTLIGAILFLFAGVILLCISVLGEAQTTWYLSGALACIAVANILNLINARKTKQQRKNI